MTERDIFLAALDINCPTDRAAYLTQACADNPALRERLDAMLAFHNREDSFLRESCVTTCPQPYNGTIAEDEGTLIGRYKLLEKIGEGGFAIVFMAEQTEPVRRRVALKVIKPGMDSKQVIGRFEAERQALALMDHPNIAKVFDGGVTDSGRPYFVMELVNGVPLTDYCDTFKLDTNLRLAIFVQICHAVQHAHQKGVIHRDLKPSNVLITLHDDTPVPKVIDFGISKATQQRLTERTVFTRFRHFIGTPAYMSPEQATFSGLDIDTRSDVYSLGVLLYELLTGVTPFDKQKLCDMAYDELCRIIRDDQPPAPSTRISTLGEQIKLVAQNRRTDPRELQHTVHGELDWIVMKALEKERSRRYDTASAMADDIERFLHHEPVVAGPPSTMYRLRKAVERNRGKVFAAAAVSLALLLGIVVSSAGLLSAVSARNEALEAKTAADDARYDEAAARHTAQQEVKRKQLLLYVADTSNAKQAWDAGNVDYAVALLKRHIPKPGATDLRTFAWYHMWDQCHQYEASRAHDAPLHALAYSPDGQVLATAGEGGLVAFLNPVTRERLFSLPVDIRTAMSLQFSPDGNTLAIGGGTGEPPRPGSVEIWDWKRRTRLRTLQPGNSQVACVTYTADGQRLACSNYGGVIQIWDLTGADVKPQITIQQPDKLTYSIQFSPDGQTLAAGSWSEGARFVRFWDIRTAEETQTVELNGNVRGLAYSPDGTFVAAGTMIEKGSVNVIDIASGGVRTLPSEDCLVEMLVFSPDGQKLIVGNWKGSIQIFDLPSGDLAATLKGHSSVVTGLSLSPDGKTLASCSHDRTIKFWDFAAARPPETRTIGHNRDAPWMKFSHDSKLLATSNFRMSSEGPVGSVRLWDVASGKLLATCRQQGPGVARCIAFSRAGDLLAWADGDRGTGGAEADTIVVRKLATGRHQVLAGFGARPLQMNFSSDSRLLTAIGYRPSSTQPSEHALSSTTWNLDTGERLNQEELASLELSPAAQRAPPGFPRFRHAHWGPEFYTRLSHNGGMFARGDGSFVRLWNLATADVRVLEGRHSEFVFYVAFSFTDEFLATCSQDKSICLWNTKTGDLVQTLVGRTWPITLAFAPDGKTLASGDLDGKVTLWDLRTFTEILTLDAEADVVNGLAFAPDGQALACGTLVSGKIHIWRAPRW
jgi:WD40 repeat protein/serine/threonine protein kinase